MSCRLVLADSQFWASLARALALWALSLLVLSGCSADYGHTRDIRHPAKASPAPGAGLAADTWTGAWKEDSVGSRIRATFNYGPWQCNRRWMASCQQECREKDLQLMGCMWLADIKYDWQAPVMPIMAGSRYALWHCCCSYVPLSKEDTARRRAKWESETQSLRKKWSEVYGAWPETQGKGSWPGHHKHDLKRGGEPTDLGNIFPTPPAVHSVFNREYPRCYQGASPWNAVGPDLPYRDR